MTSNRIRSAFLRVEHALTHTALIASCVVFGMAALVGLIQIVTRFVFKYPTPWSEASIRILLIWTVFLSVPIGFRSGSMISVDLLHQLSRGAWRRVLEVAILVACVGLLAVITWLGIRYCMIAGFRQTIIGLEPMRMIWAYLAVPVGCGLAIISVFGAYLAPPAVEPDLSI